MYDPLYGPLFSARRLEWTSSPSSTGPRPFAPPNQPQLDARVRDGVLVAVDRRVWLRSVDRLPFDSNRLKKAEPRHRCRPITKDKLVADDWALCQHLGTEAHAVGDQGIRTYFATGVDMVLVVFPELLGGSLTEVELVERWDDLADLV